MTIAAVVPAWNAADRIERVLASLADQVDLLIVVDNGSDDKTVNRVRDWAAARTVRLELLALPVNLGYAAAINRGIGRARVVGADDILVANDDVEFQPGSVERLAEALERNSRAGAATAKLLYSDRPAVMNGAGGEWLRWRGLARLRGEGAAVGGEYDRPARVDYPSGAASLLRGAALDEVGLLNDRYFLYYEDVDWGLRARERGWSIDYVPKAEVRHVGWAGTRGNPVRRRYYNVRNRIAFAGRWAPLPARAWVWLATLWLLAKRVAKSAAPGRRADALAIARGARDGALGRLGPGAAFDEGQVRKGRSGSVVLPGFHGEP